MAWTFKPGREANWAEDSPMASAEATLSPQRESGDDTTIERSSNCFQFQESPSYVRGKLREYQIRGLNWLIELDHNGLNGILADEMGLGKTIQACSLLGYLKNHCGSSDHGPHLIVVPTALVLNWVREFERFLPSLRTIVFRGSRDARRAFVRDFLMPGGWDAVITTPEVCIVERATLCKFSWRYIVIDEAHRIKSMESKLSLAIGQFKSRNRLLLSGTPLQNNLAELRALFNFIVPNERESPHDVPQEDGATEAEAVEKVLTLLRPLMLRRRLRDLPDWTSATHRECSRRQQAAVVAVLLVAQRLDTEQSVLPRLPLEMWLAILGIVPRWALGRCY